MGMGTAEVEWAVGEKRRKPGEDSLVFLDVLPWASYLTSLCLFSLITRDRHSTSSVVFVKLKGGDICKVLWECLVVLSVWFLSFFVLFYFVFLKEM